MSLSSPRRLPHAEPHAVLRRRRRVRRAVVGAVLAGVTFAGGAIAARAVDSGHLVFTVPAPSTGAGLSGARR
ncbi:MAG TPA: hypothetical protein VFG42_14580 [Baekduia sp.]|uniref:hypothetical protein n=1 Tax=Baekduia sp. TaxID=2600305 RepID=UPI002D77E2BE|nr:hypothetical protein [Baekduia sp.]HET6508013.1 hypothetical protein [Baekduia sp.]